jgi:D,D-heptose 1,7-bisphosphate phosphatase
MSRPAVFFDRDGTINEDPGYLGDVNLVKLFSDAVPALSILKNKLNFLLIVISNQSGIARGIITKEQVDFVNHKINELLSEGHAEIDKYYYCPHHPEYNSSEECNCRKPSPELVYQASKEFDIDLKRSYFIGDSISDYECAKNAGCKFVLIKTGNGLESISALQKQNKFPSFAAANLMDAVNFIQNDFDGEIEI